MKMIYSSESSFLANNVKNIMEAQQIDTFIKNEFSQGAVGEISAFDAWPEVWVFNDEDYERALTIVEGIVATLNDQTALRVANAPGAAGGGGASGGGSSSSD